MIAAFQTDEMLYFVLEYCPGGELFYHLKSFGIFTLKRYNISRFKTRKCFDKSGWVY
jgi:serine/threonine protein kinase